MDRVYNVLFLCTHNSARSVMAESILNREGRGKFKAFSAGSQPSGTVHPFALDLLRRSRHDTGALRSKSWDEFAVICRCLPHASAPHRAVLEPAAAVDRAPGAAEEA